MTDPFDLPEPLVPERDPATLRERFADRTVVDRRIGELRARIAGAPDETAELMARGELVDLLRATDDASALDQAMLARDRAELVGAPAQQHLAALRVAQAQQRLGADDPAVAETADERFAAMLAGAPQFGPIIVALTHQLAGYNDLDRARYDVAAEHFAAALALRREFELPDDAIAESQQGLDLARRRAGEST